MNGLLRLIIVALIAVATSYLHASCLTLYPLGERPETLDTHACFSLCLGARTTSEKDHIAYHGLTLGLAHASMPDNDIMRMFRNESCDFNGATIQLLSQLNHGTVRGLSLTGLVAIQRSIRGVQLSGLANDARDLKGLQMAIGINMAQEICGVQIGLLNVTSKLTGVQIGLLNVNRAGLTLPLLNASF